MKNSCRSNKSFFIVITVLLGTGLLPAQSGGWDASTLNGTTGYNDWGSGVIQLMDLTFTGAAGSAIHETSDTYDATSAANFHKCYQVFFACPGANDNIGSDVLGDGMSFSFSKCAYDINAGASGGGLGYHGACAQMITVEFDTYSNQGGGGFDGSYGGGVAGTDDEVAIHFGGDATDAGRLTSANAGNLEDGLEHWICIRYDPVSDLMTITKDAATILTYDFTGSPYDLPTYFGAGGLNQSWGTGKNGATLASTVSNGVDISNTVGNNLGCAILPVKLIAFTGEMKQGKVVLNWATASEINNEKFIVERSVNLIDWTAVTEVAGAGNSSAVIHYSFTDEAPVDGVAYYRLQQMDFDGVYTYSNALVMKKEAPHITVASNEDVLTVKSNIEGEMGISLHDAMGRLLYCDKQESNSSISIWSELPPGIYVVTLQTENFFEQRKIVKQ